MKHQVVKALRVPSLLLAAGLQVMPMVRAALPVAQTATNVLVIVFRWAAGAAAALGGIQAVSGGSTVITNPLSAAAKQDQSFSLRLTTAPDQAGYWSAVGLPDGLSLIGSSGRSLWKIQGTPAVSGTFDVFLTAKERSNSSADRTVTATLMLTISPGSSPPTITTQPIDLTVIQNQTAEFTVAATGTAPLNYQWRVNGVTLSGQALVTLTLNGVTVEQAGSYDVVVSNSAGSVASASATLTVLTPPVITVQPTNVATAAGQTMSFSVNATGSAPLTFQWRLNGNDLPGQTTSLLALTNVTASQTGVYDVRVSNLAGNVLSSTATLTVQAVVQPQIPEFSRVDFRNGLLVATFAAESGATYLIERSGDLVVWQTQQVVGPVAVAGPVSVQLDVNTGSRGFLRIQLTP